MKRQPYPILEFDPTRKALIEPGELIKPLEHLPHAWVICFFQEVITRLVEEGRAQHLVDSKSEQGPHPFYEISWEGQRVGLFHPGVGAPLAAGLLEEAIARGGRTFVACGGAGVLNREIAVGHIVVPHSAVRDEGTSYHYLPPSREVSADPKVTASIEAVLQRHNVPYLVGKTWTTDAIYRETPEKIQRRRDEGCIMVEMEAAAFFAVAQFRGVALGQLLYGGDDVSSETWDARDWPNQRSVREKLLWLAAEAAVEADGART